MQIIGVISDTHIPRRAKRLPRQVVDGFRNVSQILHAGDIIDENVLDELNAIAPVTAVSGNCDPAPLAEQLGRKKILHLGGYKIGLIHGDGARGSTPDRAYHAFVDDEVDCVVFGHSHQPLCEYRQRVLMFNPGSPTDWRGLPQPSYGLLYLEDGIYGEIIYF